MKLAELWRPAAALVLGGALGVAAGRTTAPEPAPVPEPPAPLAAAVPTGQTGPGFSCPARPEVESDVCLPVAGAVPSAGPAADAAIPDAPNCSTEPSKVPLMLDAVGAAVPAPPDDLFWFGRYQGVRVQPIGDGSVLNGVPTRIGQLMTHDDPNQVLQAFRVQFEANHLHPLQGLPDGLNGALYLTVRGPGDNLARTVVLVPKPDGTLILASVGSPKMTPQPLPSDLPAPEDPKGIAVDEIHDGPSRQRDFTFHVAGTLAEVKEFYLTQMGRRGFTAIDNAHEELLAGGLLWRQNFERDENQVAVSLKQSGKSPVYVSVLWIDHAPRAQGADR